MLWWAVTGRQSVKTIVKICKGQSNSAPRWSTATALQRLLLLHYDFMLWSSSACRCILMLSEVAACGGIAPCHECFLAFPESCSPALVPWTVCSIHSHRVCVLQVHMFFRFTGSERRIWLRWFPSQDGEDYDPRPVKLDQPLSCMQGKLTSHVLVSHLDDTMLRNNLAYLCNKSHTLPWWLTRPQFCLPAQVTWSLLNCITHSHCINVFRLVLL